MAWSDGAGPRAVRPGSGAPVALSPADQRPIALVSSSAGTAWVLLRAEPPDQSATLVRLAAGDAPQGFDLSPIARRVFGAAAFTLADDGRGGAFVAVHGDEDLDRSQRVRVVHAGAEGLGSVADIGAYASTVGLAAAAAARPSPTRSARRATPTSWSARCRRAAASDRRTG